VGIPMKVNGNSSVKPKGVALPIPEA
jgi:hypothetical protein